MLGLIKTKRFSRPSKLHSFKVFKVDRLFLFLTGVCTKKRFSSKYLQNRKFRKVIEVKIQSDQAQESSVNHSEELTRRTVKYIPPAKKGINEDHRKIKTFSKVVNLFENITKFNQHEKMKQNITLILNYIELQIWFLKLKPLELNLHVAQLAWCVTIQ